MMWSYPGYTVDRTPFGVIQHELGHHVDNAHGRSGGIYGRLWIEETGEDPISGYANDDPNEWFAEMFRLFITNPDLLRLLRPLTYERMTVLWKPVEHRPWRSVLEGAEEDRHIRVILKKLKER